MAHTVIVEKGTARLMLVVDSGVPVQIDAIYPAVGFNYVYWPDLIRQEVRDTPWLFCMAGNGIAQRVVGVTEEEKTRYTLASIKVRGLMALNRAVNRHRRPVVKQWLLGQDVVNSMKYDEASRFLANPATSHSIQWLTPDATRLDISVEQAAISIVFRHDQQVAVMLESETRRLQLTKAILEAADAAAVSLVVEEISAYERRG